MRKNYCKPIRYDGGQTCAVEFADTPGGIITSWRIKSEDGRIRTGICEDGAVCVSYCEPEADFSDLDNVLKPADIYDCRALKATWPTWEAMRERNSESEPF